MLKIYFKIYLSHIDKIKFKFNASLLKNLTA